MKRRPVFGNGGVDGAEVLAVRDHFLAVKPLHDFNLPV
jgi:hypothetical protein